MAAQLLAATERAQGLERALGEAREQVKHGSHMFTAIFTLLDSI